MTTEEELSHTISMQLTPAYAEWMDHKINLLDTPGYLDFTGDAIAAARVADAAVIVVGATSGVEVGTETVWRYVEARGIPRVIFVSMMDKEHADFAGVYEDIKKRLTDKALPVEIPVGAGADFRGIINLFSERTHMYKPGTTKGEYDEADIPDELKEVEAKWETELLETLATTDEALLERYLEGETITREEAIEAMARAVARGEVVPVFCGSAKKTYGMKALLKKMIELFPNPAETGGDAGSRPGLDQDVTVHADDSEPFSALVFKTANEPHVGELSYFKITSGSVGNGTEVTNAERGGTEKLNHLSIGLGRDRLEVPRLHAGDIGVVAKLKNTHTNDTLSSPERPLILEKISFPKPDIAVAVKGVTRGDEDKLGEVLHRLHEEDPTFHGEFNGELHQTIARGLGELHLDVNFERMKRKFGVSVETEEPKIAYRETLTKSAQGQGRFKKQSGGRGQFGDCWVRLKPRTRGEGYEFVNSIKGGVIPGKYVPSVDKGIQEAAQRGVVAGFPVVDFEAECYDGSYHSVDSSDIAFKVAGSLAFQKVAAEARPVLLEPIMEVEVTAPEEYMGDIIGDITQRRGRPLGTEMAGGRAVIKARVPESELYKYASSLRSITQGRGHHARTFVGYEPVPHDQTSKIVAEAKAAAEA
jgi:elongation factor G